MEKLRLKGPVYMAPFNRSEDTIYNEFKKTEYWKGDPGAGEAYVFLSYSGNQLLWVLNAGELSDGTAALYTRRIRLSREASWERLQEYANQIGYRLNNKFKTIQQLVEDHRRALHGGEE